MNKHLFFFIFFLTILCSCKQHKQQEFSQTKFLMDTICEIKIISTNKTKVDEAIKKVFQEVEQIDKTFGYSLESEIVNINSMSGIKPVKVSPQVFELIKKSIKISELTKGQFDITTGVLTALWKFEYNNHNISSSFSIPTQQEINKVLTLVGYKNILLDEKNLTVFLTKKGMKLTLGGIAKGYAINRAKEILESFKFENFLINFGGDIYVKGKNKNNTFWKIAVQHPRKKNEFLCTLELSDTAIATSGDYERYFIVNGKRYHHIFDPSTGYPVENIVSVTVLYKDPILADAIATSIFALGEKRGIEFAKKHKIEYIVVTQQKNKLTLYVSEQIKKLISNINL